MTASPSSGAASALRAPAAGRSAQDRVDLTVLARALAREGFDDFLAGHITVKCQDGTLLCNPWGLGWDEFSPDDVLRISQNGDLLEGAFPVPPGIPLHLALHEWRKDIAVAVHNHPAWSTIWADAHRVPPIYDQTSAMSAARVVLCNEYEGSVDDREVAGRVVRAMGDADVALLAHHGVFVLAGSVPQAYLRGVALERRSWRAWHVEALRPEAEPLDDATAHRLGTGEVRRVGRLWPAALRRELRDDPALRSA